MNTLRIATIAFFACTGFGTVASAQTWTELHPGRAEVNDRLADQTLRIEQGVRDGQLTQGEARRLRTDDRVIRAEERADAVLDGGHISRGEQRLLNAQENATSAAIAADRRF